MSKIKKRILKLALILSFNSTDIVLNSKQKN